MSKMNYILKWTFLAILNFTIIEEMASRNSSEVVYIGDLSRHWIISKGTQIPKGIGWYKLKPATKPTVVVQSNFFKLQIRLTLTLAPFQLWSETFGTRCYGPIKSLAQHDWAQYILDLARYGSRLFGQ